jgi:hypothetical protein
MDPETGFLFNPQEYQAYTTLRTRIFEHTKIFDKTLLTKIGMDEEFDTVFSAFGWQCFWHLFNDRGSRLLTLEVYFRLFNQEYNMTTDQFSHALGFTGNCSIDLEHATSGFNRLEFSHSITGLNDCEYPWTNGIHCPTLLFLHRWIGVTRFPRDDVRIVRNDDLRLLYAMVHKIHVSPVKAMVAH